MEVSEDFTITLRLGQQPLSITIRREDEEAYRAAEKLINQKYNSYAAQYPDQGNEIYLCMAALSIALSLKKNEFRNDTQPFVDSMKRMLDTLDETLRKHNKNIHSTGKTTRTVSLSPRHADGVSGA